MKGKYHSYGVIYQSQCVNCVKECTSFCQLNISDERCLNFKCLDDLKYSSKSY